MPMASTIAAASTAPMKACPGRPPPPEATSIGAATAPSSVPTSAPPMRQAMMRVRSWVSSLNSAAMAAYGTAKSAYPLMPTKKARPATGARIAGPTRAGRWKVAQNASPASSAPATRKGWRRPQRLRSRSEATPTSGSKTTSHNLGMNSTRPASAAATPSVSVR